MDTHTLTLKIAAEMASFLRDMKTAEKHLDMVAQAGDTVKNVLGGLFAGLSVGVAVGKLIEVQREFDKLNSVVKTLAGSQAAAEKEMAWIKDFAANTSYGLAQATQGFAKLKALGLDPSRAALTSYGNTAAAMGKDLMQMIEAVADASVGEFERLKEFGIKAKKNGDEVALTFQGVTTTVGNNAQEITQYLDGIGNNQFAGAMSERAKTLDGALANLGDTVDEVFRTVSSLGIGGTLADGARLASDSLTDLISILQALENQTKSASDTSVAFKFTQEAVAVIFETVVALGANVKYVLVQIGNELGGLAAQAVQLAQLNLTGAAAIRAQMIADSEAARKEVDATTARILNARALQAAIDKGKGADEPMFARLLTQKKVWTENNELTKDQIKLLNELSGVSNDYQADLSALKSAYDKGNLTQAQYVKYVEQLIAKQPGIKKGHDDSKKAAEETAKILAELSGVTASYQEDLTRLDKMRKSGLITESQYIELVEQLIAKQPAAKKQIEEMTKAQEAGWKVVEARNKAVEEAAKLEAQYQAALDARLFEEAWERDQKALRTIEDRIKAGRTMLDQMQFENSLLTMTSQQRAIAVVEREMERQGIVKGTEAYIKYADAIKQAVLDKEAITEAQNFWSSIEQTAHGVWVDVANGGESAFKKIGQTLKAAVLDMLWQMTGRKWLISLGASMGVPGAAMAQQQMGGMAGNLGMSAMSNYVGEAFSGLGATVFGNPAAYSMFAGIGGQQGAMLAAQTAEFGLSGLAATAEAAGSAMASVASALPMIGAAIGVIALLASLDDSGTMHTGGLGSYSKAGGIAVGDAVKGQSSGFFNLASADYQSSTEQASVKIAQSIVGILDSTASTFGKQAGYYAATAFADDTSDDGAWGGLTIKLAEKIVADWGSGGDGFLGKVFADGEAGAKEYAAAVGKDVRDYLLTQTPQWADDMLMALGDAPSIDTLATTIQEVNALQKSLETAGLGSLFDDITTEAKNGSRVLRTDLIPWMQKLANQGGPTAATLKAIANYPAELLTLAGTSRDNLVKIYTEGFMSGDVMGAGQTVADTLVASIEQTIVGAAAGQIFDILNRGIVTPIIDAMLNGQTLAEALSQSSIDAAITKAKEQAEVLSAIYNDERFKELLSGLKTTLGGALGGAGASFTYTPQYQQIAAANDLTDAAKEAADAAEDARKRWQDITDALLSDQAQLQIDLLRAQGKEEQALAAERARAIVGYDEYQVGLYDSNAAIRAQIKAIEDATAAREKEAQAAQNFWGAADSVADRFLSGANLDKYKNARLAQGLADVGIVAAQDIFAFGQVLQGMKPDQIRGLVAEFLRLPSASTDAKTAVLTTGAALIDMANASAEAAAQAAEAADAQRKQAAEAAFAYVQRAYDKQKQIYTDAQAAATKTAETLKGIFDLLRSNARELFGQVETTKLMLSGEGMALIDAALAGGTLPSQTALAEAIAAVRATLTTQNYSSQFEFDRAQLLLANKLTALQAIGGTQLTEAEKAAETAKAQLAALDAQLATEKAQLDALKGIDSSVLSMVDALSLYHSALANANAGGAVGGGSSMGASRWLNAANGAFFDTATSMGMSAQGWAFDAASVTKAAQDVLAAQGIQALYDVAKSTGFSIAQAETIFGVQAGSLADVVQALGLPAFASGGLHSGGLALVGERGPELVDFASPARIYTAQQTAAALANSGGEFVAAEIAQLRSDMRDYNLSLARVNNDLLSIQRKWDVDGLPATRAA